MPQRVSQSTTSYDHDRCGRGLTYRVCHVCQA